MALIKRGNGVWNGRIYSGDVVRWWIMMVCGEIERTPEMMKGVFGGCVEINGGSGGGV
jgi:hypothetical protein